MHTHDLRPFSHSHAFGDAGQARRERSLTWVTAVTLLTMLVELLAGWWTSSLALTADGWHMGTHALALGGAVVAYRLSRHAARHRAVAGGTAGFAFGGWKIEVLAAYTSGLVLLAVAGWLAWEGVSALRVPRPVIYQEALVVAVIGLLVNLACVWLLSSGSRPGPAKAVSASTGAPTDGGPIHAHHPHPADHAHRTDHADHADHGHHHADHHGHHGDHNFSAAYLHVLADTFTSVLAIAALAGGAWFGMPWLDPAVALLGAAVIAQWSWRMLRSTATALVDATEDPVLTQHIRALIEADGDAQLADLHVWQVGAQAWSAALAVVADAPLPAAAYRQRLAVVKQLKHVTVEVHGCPGDAAVPRRQRDAVAQPRPLPSPPSPLPEPP